MDYAEESLNKHAQWVGKIEVISTASCKTKEDLSLAYTPGVARSCLEIQKDVDEIVNTVYLLSGSFGGVNLENISAPRRI